MSDLFSYFQSHQKKWYRHVGPEPKPRKLYGKSSASINLPIPSDSISSSLK